MSYSTARRGLSVLIIFGMVAGLFSSAIWLPANPIQIQPSQTHTDNKTTASNDKSAVKDIPLTFMDYATLAIAIFTGGLFIATLRLVKNADKSSERQLRAYVFVGKHGIHDLTKEVPLIKLTIQNGGQTPAHNVKMRLGFQEFPATVDESSIVVPAPREEAKGGYLPSGQTFDITLNIIPDTAADIARIISGEVGIIVYGIVEYKDIFDCDRTTRFRVFTKKANREDHRQLGYSEIGNEAN